MDEKFYTYILLTEKNTLYCGWTNDLEKRFENHKKGVASKYTRAHKPVKFVYVEHHESKSEAMRAECRIKKLSKKQKEILITNYS